MIWMNANPKSMINKNTVALTEIVLPVVLQMISDPHLIEKLEKKQGIENELSGEQQKKKKNYLKREPANICKLPSSDSKTVLSFLF